MAATDTPTTAGVETPVRVAAPTRDRDRARVGPSLATVGRAFWRHPSPRIIASAFAITATVRLVLADWGPGDAYLAMALVAYHPVNEWLLHNYVLHMRPLRLFGRTFDTHLAQKHRAHHADPTDLPLVFIPTRTLWAALAFTIVLFGVVMPTWELRVMGVAVTSAIGLVYEWTHYLVHTEYRPRSRWYRWIWRTHRLHHYKNENYWYAFTVPAVDVAFRTWPQPSEVDTSATVRDLLGTGAPGATEHA